MKSVSVYKSRDGIHGWCTNEVQSPAALFSGDCEELLAAVPEASVDLIISSPPYCMGKAYEKGNDLETFTESHKKVLPLAIKALKPGGSLCWQVGFHVKDNVALPLDFLVYQIGAIPKVGAADNRASHSFHGAQIWIDRQPNCTESFGFGIALAQRAPIAAVIAATVDDLCWDRRIDFQKTTLQLSAKCVSRNVQLRHRLRPCQRAYHRSGFPNASWGSNDGSGLHRLI